MVRGDASGDRERLGIGSANQILQSDGTDPAWATLSTAASVLTTQGDILYESASGLARLGQSTDGHVLTTKGAGANPVWAAAGGLWTALGTDSSTSGKSSLSVAFTQTDIIKVYAYIASASTTSGDIIITLNADTSSIYSMRGDYAANETSYQAQANWSATFGNSIPQRPVNLELTLFKQDSNIAGNGGLTGMMLGSANYDIAGASDIVNTWSNSGLLYDSTSAITSLEISHDSVDNILGNLQVNGMDYQ